MLKSYALGIDIGTTSTKVVLFDEKGAAVAHHSKNYPLLAEIPGSAEQNPDEIYEAVIYSLRETVRKSGDLAEKIGFISFSTAMHSLIAVDAEGKPLTNSITWADTRSESYAFAARSSAEGLDLYKRTGVPLHPMTPLFKLQWLKNEQPDIFKNAAKFVGIKEYILYRWFGEWAIDYASAAAMGLWNMQTLDWDQEALEMADVTAEKLPEIKPTTFYWDSLSVTLEKLSGLDSSVKVVIGATDGPLSNLGVGAISPGDVAVTIGTSGAIRTISKTPILDAEGRTFCYPLTEKHWVSGGPVNNGGIAFQWVHDVFTEVEKEGSYEKLSKRADAAPPGSDGLIFLPHLTGERAPLWDAQAKGSFIGLTLRHKKDHMVRAVLEGTIFNLYQVYSLVKTQTQEKADVKIFATGGFTNSPAWKQILADVFQKEVNIPEHTESSCLGAVQLGRFALDETDVLQEVSEEIKQYSTVMPNTEHAETYGELFTIYQNVSDALASQYKAIHEFQNK
ncbi:gluconokinase [Fictibacillus phosphorivorans]|uniref:gluconokinase n=1 Tax=Fictibacillus phosphorivorans TaxID=1221500 RepID=UPI002040A673|nr:FGGY family carbohydrate kinase [Fictibacillus phosphorivorans]MCM3718389.1 FGGY family carbohydrate kinase [Fictibacillus phosphorivorans]MCM3776013.1 FGGY family carbohydrate kinase [Fictibacillus phosphorivorans]